MNDPLLRDWTIKEENTIIGGLILDKNHKISISPGTNMDTYKLKVPFEGPPQEIDNVENKPDETGRSVLSGIFSPNPLIKYGIRLVFEPPDDPNEFVEGPLGSTVEKWLMLPQP